MRQGRPRNDSLPSHPALIGSMEAKMNELAAFDDVQPQIPTDRSVSLKSKYSGSIEAKRNELAKLDRKHGQTPESHLSLDHPRLKKIKSQPHTYESKDPNHCGRLAYWRLDQATGDADVEPCPSEESDSGKARKFYQMNVIYKHLSHHYVLKRSIVFIVDTHFDQIMFEAKANELTTTFFESMQPSDYFGYISLGNHPTNEEI